MPTLSFNKQDLPFILGGDGQVAVETAKLDPLKPLPDDTTLLSVSFKGGSGEGTTLGLADTVKIGVTASTSLKLTPVFADSAAPAQTLLETYGVGNFFSGGANRDRFVLCLEVGAASDASAVGAFPYASLQASAELEAGADAGYAYLRAFDRTTSLTDALIAFFRSMRLPAQAAEPPDAGEASCLRYGGYLRLSAQASAGYQLAGTASTSLGGLALSETYDLSIVGRIGLSAGVAGRFSILSTAGHAPGWTRVQVRRHRAEDMKIAADVNVGYKNALDLPADANEFLGAVLGVNGKSFLAVFKKAEELSDFDRLKAALDGLAERYVEAVIGRGFDALSEKTEFTKFLATVNRIVASYEEVEDRAVTLFDRYYDRLDQLTPFLDKLQGLSDEGLAELQKDLTPELWSVLSQLTGGDPLGFLLGRITIAGQAVESLPLLKARAANVLGLIRDDGHKEIRHAIGIAKSQFGLDQFFRALAKVDTPEELQAIANDRVGLFATRLVGRSLDSATNLKKALEDVHAVLAQLDAFSEKVFQAFKQAANSSYAVALHAEYSRASETDALVDVSINVQAPRGRDLLRLAGTGDFEEILTLSDTDAIRLNEGVLTHRTQRPRAFNVNIVGWHANYKYDGIDRLVTETEQRLVPSDHGITIRTTTSVELDRQRKRGDEAVHVSFLLRALGESAGVVRSDARTLAYLVEVLGSLEATYSLAFTDDDTSETELKDYLAFAGDVGLDTQGATFAMLAPLLPRSRAGSFGKLTTSYEVRFGQPALNALLAVKTVSQAAEQAIRDAMRQMTLSNYLKSDEMHDVAFAYATPGVFDVFHEEGAAQFSARTRRTFNVRSTGAGIAAPASVTLDQMKLNVLATLYNIENQFVSAIRSLYKLLGGKTVEPVEFEKALGAFGDALKLFDDFDQTSNRHGVGTSTVFAMFDRLVRLASGRSTASASVLRLKSEVDGREVEKLFLSDVAAAR